MDYKEVLENQIKKLIEVQDKVLEGIIDGIEKAMYTQTTLSLVASTALKIQSIVITANELGKTATNGN